MTVPSTTSRVTYVGTGAVTTYPYTFRIFATTDLEVIKTDTNAVETTLVLDTDYTVTGAGSYSGGNVVLGTALAADHTLVIRRVLPLTQTTDLRNQGEFFAETHESAFDRLTMIAQQQQEVQDRTLQVPASVDDIDPALPVPEDGAYLQWAPGTSPRRLQNAVPIDPSTALSGSQTVDRYVAGVGFTAGVTTSLTLSRAPGNKNATIVSFDGVLQHKSQYSTSGSTLTFTAAIPSGVSEVEVVTYAVLATGQPADGSDASTFEVRATGSRYSRTLAARTADVVNVKDFGATGDGATDDRSSIVAALSYAWQNGHPLVYFPAGHYKISASISIPDSKLTMSGDGIYTIVETTGASNPKVFVLNGINDVTINGMKLIPYSSGSERSAVDVTSCSRCKFSNLYIAPVDGNGVYLIDSDYCCVDNLFFDGGVDMHGYAVIIAGGVGNRVTNCNAYRPRFGFVVEGGDIAGTRSSRTSAQTYGNIFSACTVTGASGHSFDVNSSQGNIFIGCHANNWGGSGDPTPAFQNKHSIGDNTRQNVFSGCTVYNYGNGFYSQDGSNALFVGCSAFNITYSAFWIMDANRCVVSGCIAREFGLDGLRVEGSAVNNTFTGINLETSTTTAIGINLVSTNSSANNFDNIVVANNTTLAYSIKIASGANNNRFGPGVRTNDMPISDASGATCYPYQVRSDRNVLGSTGNTAGDAVPRGMHVARAKYYITTTVVGTPQMQAGKIGNNAMICTAQNVTGSAGAVNNLTLVASPFFSNDEVVETRCSTAGSSGEGFIVFEGFVRN